MRRWLASEEAAIVSWVVTGSGRIGAGRVATEGGSPTGEPHKPQKLSDSSPSMSHVAQRGAAVARRSARFTSRRAAAASRVRYAHSSGVTGAGPASVAASVTVTDAAFLDAADALSWGGLPGHWSRM